MTIWENDEYSIELISKSETGYTDVHFKGRDITVPYPKKTVYLFVKLKGKDVRCDVYADGNDFGIFPYTDYDDDVSVGNDDAYIAHDWDVHVYEFSAKSYIRFFELWRNVRKTFPEAVEQLKSTTLPLRSPIFEPKTWRDVVDIWENSRKGKCPEAWLEEMRKELTACKEPQES
jgi:hypothetical protein